MIGCILPGADAQPAPAYTEILTRIRVARVQLDDPITAAAMISDELCHPNLWEPIEYKTPGTGRVYTLATLAQAAGSVLETSSTCYVLHGRVDISKGDLLRFQDDHLLIADKTTSGPSYVYHEPALVIWGRVSAENSTITSRHPDHFLTETSSAGNGLFIIGPGQDGEGSATLTNCAIQGVGCAVVGYAGANISLNQTSIENCFIGAACCGALVARGCRFKGTPSYHGSGLVSSGSKVDLTDCEFNQAGASLHDSQPGSRIEGCVFNGWISPERRAYCGLYITEHEPFGRPPVLNPAISDNRIAGYGLGLLCVNASPLIENNTIEQSFAEAMTFGWYSLSRVRGNIVRDNADTTWSTPRATIIPAGVMILDAASPDLGTQADPGRNVFLNNGPLTLYHAGPSTDTLHAQGNVWNNQTDPAAIERDIYHRPDDAGDADGSGFVSGEVIFQPATRNSSQKWTGYK